MMGGSKAKKPSMGMSSKSSFDDSYASNATDATDATDDDDDLLLETMNSVSTLNETQVRVMLVPGLLLHCCCWGINSHTNPG
jgi:hypothetical protein